MIPLPSSDDRPDATESARSPAESTFAWFAARCEAGEEMDFETFLADHPDQEEELRTLHAAWSEGAGTKEEDPAPVAVPVPTDSGIFAGSPAAGRRIGEFRLVQRIGQGGMGEVWEAVQESLDRTVALKILLPGRLDEKAIEFFAREARAGGKLTHPGIVAVHASGETDGVHWISMELVPGGATLGDFLEDARSGSELPEDYYREVATLVAKVADALEAAHVAGVIHRDVKPRNVLITLEDEPKVADFGLARVVSEHSLSMTGDFAGTYFYMSPEQVMARRMGIDHRTDIFSLGVVLYELLTLTRPFEGDTTHQIAQKIMLDDPPDPQQIRSRVPIDLAVICGKMLEKSPDHRYPSMAELAADLRHYLAHEPILAKPPTTVQRVAKWVRRNPTKSAVGAVAAAAFVIIASLLLRIAGQRDELQEAYDRAVVAEAGTAEERDRAVALEIAAKEERDRARQAAYSGNLSATQIAGSLWDGNAEARQHLEACPEELRQWEWDHLDLIVGQKSATMEGHESPVYCVAWSPDGTRVVSGGDDNTLRIWDASSGESLKILEGQGGRVVSLAWGPNGTRIASGASDGTVGIWDAATGESLQILELRDILSLSVAGRPDDGMSTFVVSPSELPSILEMVAKAPISMAWSPDGKRIVGATPIGLVIWDTASGDILQNLTHEVDAFYVPTCIDWSPDGTRIVTGSSGAEGLYILDLQTGEGLESSKGGLEWDHAAQIGSLQESTRVSSVAWSPDGTRIVSGSQDNSVRIWDASSGRGVRILLGHTDDVRSVAWSPDSTRIVSGSRDRTLRIWNTADDTADGGFELQLAGHRSGVNSVAWSPDGTHIVSGSSDHTLGLWDAATGEIPAVQVLKAHQGRVPSLSWNFDGTRLVSASPWDRSVRIWDAVNGRLLQTLKGDNDYVPSCAAWSPDGRWIVTGRNDGTLDILDGTSGVRLKLLEEVEEDDQVLRQRVLCVAWSPSGERVASGGFTNYDNGGRSGVFSARMRIWDATTGKCLQFVGAYGFDSRGPQSFDSLAWSPDGTRIVTGGIGGRTRDQNSLTLWDVASGKQLLTGGSPEGHRGRSGSLAWSPDGTRIVSASQQNLVHIWEASSLKELHVLEGHSMPVNAVAWSPDSTRIISGGTDQTLRIWNAANGESLLVMDGYDSEVDSVAWSSDGRRIASGSADGTLRIWESRLEDARPAWRAEDFRRSTVQPLLDALYEELLVPDLVETALRGNNSLSPELREAALLLAAHQTPPSHITLHRLARARVDPNRAEEGDVSHALAWARAAVEAKPDHRQYRNTLAWALFANGLYSEAETQMQRALELADKPLVQRDQSEDLDRLRTMIEEARAAGGEDE